MVSLQRPGLRNITKHITLSLSETASIYIHQTHAGAQTGRLERSQGFVVKAKFYESKKGRFNNIMIEVVENGDQAGVAASYGYMNASFSDVPSFS